jgi:hypothetical protein
LTFKTGFAPEQARHLFGLAELKAQQSAKIRELREALVAAGYTALDEQAKVLGLSRSTAWTILNGRHKSSGLCAATINRMLQAPRLPQLARAKIFEYIEEKTAGRYGHADQPLRKFSGRLNIVQDCESANSITYAGPAVGGNHSRKPHKAQRAAPS